MCLLIMTLLLYLSSVELSQIQAPLDLLELDNSSKLNVVGQPRVLLHDMKLTYPTDPEQ